MPYTCRDLQSECAGRTLISFAQLFRCHHISSLKKSMGPKVLQQIPLRYGKLQRMWAMKKPGLLFGEGITSYPVLWIILEHEIRIPIMNSQDFAESRASFFSWRMWKKVALKIYAPKKKTKRIHNIRGKKKRKAEDAPCELRDTKTSGKNSGVPLPGCEQVMFDELVECLTMRSMRRNRNTVILMLAGRARRLHHALEQFLLGRLNCITCKCNEQWEGPETAQVRGFG